MPIAAIYNFLWFYKDVIVNFYPHSIFDIVGPRHDHDSKLSVHGS